MKTYTIDELNVIINHWIKVFRDAEATCLGDDDGQQANNYYMARIGIECLKSDLNKRVED